MPVNDSAARAASSPPAQSCGCEEHQAALVSRRRMFELTAVAGLVTASTVHGARVAFAAPSPSPTGTASASPSPSASPSTSRSPSPSRSVTPSASPSLSPSGRPSASPSASGSPLAPVSTTGTADVLVVISLRGGFDGLSAIVPAGDANYLRARPSVGLPASTLKKVDTTFGLAPGLEPLYPLWDAGRVAAIHAVGQADDTRSHFEAAAAMERAAPGSSVRSGWLDRCIGAAAGAGSLAAAQVGNTTMPASLYGEHSKFAVASLRDIRIGVDENTVPFAAWKRAMTTLHKGARPMLARPTLEAVEAVGKLKSLPQAVEAQAAGYPGGGLGNALHDVAQLIKANLGLRFATVDYGNWDMHQNMGGPEGGWMFNQLSELAGAMAAFATELGPLLGQVTVVTLSEFGRRVEQNGSNGVDHGHGNAVLLMGGGIKGGKVYGAWPGLAPSALDSGDLAGRTDYRSVMSEILSTRCGVAGVSEVFPGFRPGRLGFTTPRST